MKIKTVKKMNVLELAQAVRDGEVESGFYTSVINGDVIYFGSKVLKFRNVGQNAVEFSDYFEVETLEELTEETPIPTLMFGVYVESGKTYSDYWDSGAIIKNIKANYPECDFMSFYDSKTGKRIWTKENGFEDGVLEVSE